MARHYIITIGRSFGSCGREIGEKLSKELGVSFYDRNLILMAAKKSGMKMELLESADEKLLNRFLNAYASMNSTMGTTNDRLFRVQSRDHPGDRGSGILRHCGTSGGQGAGRIR